MVQYLRRSEWACIALTSQLNRLQRTSEWLFKRMPIFIHKNGDESGINGTIAVIQRGLVIPFWEETWSPRNREQKYAIRSLFNPKKIPIHTIMGLSRCVSVIDNILPGNPISIDYYLMTKEGGITDYSAVPPYPELVVKRAAPEDSDRLLPLQEGYEKEEVLIDINRFNEQLCLQHLEQMLEEQLIFYIELNGKPVAKAGTNAIGFDYCQLGGVYTTRALRNRGIGSFLIKFLTREILRNRKMVSLFVKKENEAAIHVYRKAGFTLRDDFRISYYRG